MFSGRSRRSGNRSPHERAAPYGSTGARGRIAGLLPAASKNRTGSRLPASPEAKPGCTIRAFETSKRVFGIRTISTRLSANGHAISPPKNAWSGRRPPVPAGVCQTAEDRCDHDPQLGALEWLTEVEGAKIGLWPVAEAPFKLSRTPAHIAGLISRSAPCYGEDNEYVFG